MRFFLILMQQESAWASAPGEGERVYQAYVALEERMKREKVYVDSIRLRFSDDAKSLHYYPNRRMEMVDGPFAAAAEQMGGAYILDCPSMEDALEWAKRMPNYGHGGIEVRPIWG